MANDEGRREPENLGQDPYVERLRPDPSQPPEAVRILEGFLGDSDREGYKRLYFTRELDYYAEFRTEDVVFSESIPPDEPPFLGQEATRVGIRRDATVEYTHLRTPRPVDEFDLDIRLEALGGRRAEGLLIPQSRFEPCPDCTGRLTGCGPLTDDQLTCETCQTRCRTQCDEWTCNHPPTQGGQWTCNHPPPPPTQGGQWTCNHPPPPPTQGDQWTCNHDTEVRCPTEFGTHCPTCRCF